jgi:hypothetical protein
VRANEAVGRRADWSVLLALLAETTRDEVVLRRCRLSAGAGRAPRVGPPRGTLEVDGFGSTQSAVSDFVLRLEHTQLFRYVKLIETRREPLGTGFAVAFRIECVFE